MYTFVEKINEASLKKARELILDGQLVAFPTETVYGLGANALDENAVYKIFAAKNRPCDNPLIAHIYKPEMIDDIARDVSDDAWKIIKTMMPGSLTVVLNKKPCIPDNVTGGLNTVAVRMPLSLDARKFIEACGVPIAAPSANLSSRPSPTTYQAVYEDMNGRIPLILAGDECKVGIESTVIDMTGEPIILRPGVVTAAQFEKVLGKPVKVLTDPKSKVNSPGVRYKHYAPSVPAVLNTAEDVNAVKAFYDEILKKGQNPVILCKNEFMSQFDDRNVYSLGDSDMDVLHRIFTALRFCEKKYDYIIEMFCPKSDEGYSVLNRMTKSVGGNLI